MSDKLDCIIERLEDIQSTLFLIARQVNREYRRDIRSDQAMSEQLDDLTREVAESRTVTESAATLIAGLADQIRAAANDPAAIAALATSLDAQSAALSAAVEANTPAPPQPA